MIHYIIYDTLGEIKRAGITSESNISSMVLDDGLSIMRTQYPEDFIYYKVVNGEIVKKSDVEVKDVNRPRDFAIFKSTRDSLLAASDWTQAVDSPLSEAQQQSWRDYRQKLRDLPETTTDPSNPAWPTPPA